MVIICWAVIKLWKETGLNVATLATKYSIGPIPHCYPGRERKREFPSSTKEGTLLLESLML